MNTNRRYTDPTCKDWVQGLIMIASYVVLISVTAFWLLPKYWYFWFAIMFGGLLLLVNWHTKSYAYRCRKCGAEFEISFLINLFALTRYKHY